LCTLKARHRPGRIPRPDLSIGPAAFMSGLNGAAIDGSNGR